MNKRNGLLLATVRVSSGDRWILALSPKDIIFFDHRDKAKGTKASFKLLSRVLIWRGTD